MYPLVLTLHSVLRWIVIVLGIWAVVAAMLGARRRQWTAAAARPGVLFVMALDVQLLLGLLLYLALSPITRAAIGGLANAMHVAPLRFWVVEHPAGMILAVVFAHIARTVTRDKTAGSGRRALIWYGLALLAILLATPWPFMPQGRPWVRL